MKTYLQKMKLRVFCFSCLGLLFCLSHTATIQAARNITLAQCLELGMTNNPALHASQFRTEEAQRDVQAARADFMPNLSAGYSYNRIGSISAKGPTQTDYIDQDVRAANIKLAQILYAGARISNSYDRAKILEEAAKADLQLAQLELAYQIETNFFQVIKAKQDMRTAQEAVTRLKEGANVAEAFFNREQVPYVDVLKARVDLADAENQLSIAKNNEHRYRNSLFALMNIPVDPQIDFVGAEKVQRRTVPAFEASLQQALNKRPDLQSLRYQREAAEKFASISRGKYLPTVQAEGGYYDIRHDYKEAGSSLMGNYDRDQENQYWSAGVNLSWNLFDGGRSWHESKKYELETQRLNALLKDAENTIATGIRKALYALGEAEQRLVSSEAALDAAQENYSAEQHRLQAGVSAITALLDAQSRLVRAQANRINAALDYQMAQSELKLMTGGQALP